MKDENTLHTLCQHPVQPTLRIAPLLQKIFRRIAVELCFHLLRLLMLEWMKLCWMLLLLCPLAADAAGGAASIERTTATDSLVLTVVPALEALLATDAKAARATVSALLPQVSAGGPASIALAELALEAEQKGLPTLHCEGVTLVYHWNSGEADASRAIDQAENAALALGKKLHRKGMPLKGSPKQEITGIPWSRIAPLHTDPHCPQGARALRVWKTAVGACITVLVDEAGNVQTLR